MMSEVQKILEDIIVRTANEYGGFDGIEEDDLENMARSEQALYDLLMLKLPKKHTSHEHCLLTGTLGSLESHERRTNIENAKIDEMELAINQIFGRTEYR